MKGRQKRKLCGRWLSLLMSLALVLSSVTVPVPTVVYAEENQGDAQDDRTKTPESGEAGGESGGNKGENEPASAEIILSINTPDKTSLNICENLSLSAKVTPEGTNVTWSSNNSGVATVDASGKVTAVTAGSATITAEAGEGDNKKTATINLKVAVSTGAMEIQTTLPGDQNIFPGDTLGLSLTCKEGVSQDIKNSISAVEWYVEKEAHKSEVQVNVTSDDKYSATVKAKAPIENGVVCAKITYTDSTTEEVRTNTFSVQDPIQSLEGSWQGIYPGMSRGLSVKMCDNIGNREYEVEYSTDNEQIATVTDNNEINFIESGNVNIVVALTRKHITYNKNKEVTVNSPKVLTINIKGPEKAYDGTTVLPDNPSFEIAEVKVGEDSVSEEELNTWKERLTIKKEDNAEYAQAEAADDPVEIRNVNVEWNNNVDADVQCECNLAGSTVTVKGNITRREVKITLPSATMIYGNFDENDLGSTFVFEDTSGVEYDAENKLFRIQDKIIIEGLIKSGLPENLTKADVAELKTDSSGNPDLNKFQLSIDSNINGTTFVGNYENVFSLSNYQITDDDNTGIPFGDNYTLVYTKGKLTVNQWKAFSADNINAVKPLYQDKNDSDLFWISCKNTDSDDSVVKLPITEELSNYYDQIIGKSDEVSDPVDLTKDGIKKSQIPDEGLELKIYLNNSNDKRSNTRTNEISIMIKKDNTDPKVQFIAGAGETDITFNGEDDSENHGYGIFSNQVINMKLLVTDDESGVRDVKYTIIPMTEDVSESTLKSQINMEEDGWNTVGEITDEGVSVSISVPTSDVLTEGYYIVAAYADDNAGNSCIYTSNGLVMDAEKPSIGKICLNGSEDKQYFKDDVKTTFTVSDDAGLVSVKVWYTVNDQATEKKELLTDDSAGKTLFTITDMAASKELSDIFTKEDSNNIEVHIEATDRVGLSSSAEKTFAIDLTDPTVEIKNIPAVSESGIYNDDVTLTLHAEDSKKVNSGVGLHKVSYEICNSQGIVYKDADGNEYKGSFDKEDFENKEDGAAIFETDITIPATLDSNDITIKMWAEDCAGNRSDNDEISLMIDNTAPIIKVNVTRDDDKDNDQYFYKTRTATVTFTERNFDRTKVTVSAYINQAEENLNITAENLAAGGWKGYGITAAWSPAEDPFENEDPATQKNYPADRKDTLNITFGAECGISSLTVSCTDRADHSVTTDSADFTGISPQSFIIDRTVPVVSITPVTNPTADGIYNTDVVMQIKTEDPVMNNSCSGIKTVFYEVYKDGVLDKDRSGSFKKAEGTQTTTDNKITVPKGLNSNKIEVKVRAVDYTGNVSETTQYSLMIDVTRPTISYEIDQNAVNGRYFTQPRKAEITFTERNFGRDKVTVMLGISPQRTGADKDTDYRTSQIPVKPYKASALVSGKLSAYGVTAKWTADTEENKAAVNYTDQRKNVLEITFTSECEYTGFAVSCMDKADWKSGEVTASGDAPISFVIDNTAPETTLTVQTEQKPSEEGIFNGDVVVHISVKDPASENKSWSGLDSVWYTVTSGGKETQKGEFNTKQTQAGTYSLKEYNQTFSRDITISAKDNNSNQVVLLVYAKDKAGKESVVGKKELMIDYTNPKINVSVDRTALNKRYFQSYRTATVTFTERNFDRNNVTVSIKASSGKADLSTSFTAQELVNGALKAQGIAAFWGEDSDKGTSASSYAKDRTNTLTIVFGRKSNVLYECEYTGFAVSCVDQAGRKSEAAVYTGDAPQSFVIDHTSPVPQLSITTAKPAQNIYNKDVSVGVSVTDPIQNNSYSGLKSVTYQVLNGTTVTQTGSLDISNKQKMSGSITVNSIRNNSNDVTVKLFTEDYSGNKAQKEQKMSIDITKPEITVAYDLNTPKNGMYYHESRTATVTIRERNFDPSGVTFDIHNTDGAEPKIGAWTHSADNGVSDDTVHQCKISFLADGDYTFTLSAKDLAGNEAKYDRTDEFTIDQTAPKISIYDSKDDSGDGLKYFNESRAVTITITEHNFDKNAVVFDYGIGEDMGTPVFTDDGDTHTAILNFQKDDYYELSLSTVDLAGNVNNPEEFRKQTFYIDTVEPEIKISGVEKANKGKVMPVIKITDYNFDPDGIEITLVGLNHKWDNNILVEEEKKSATGTEITLKDVEKKRDLDDLYTLTVTVTDKAGNEQIVKEEYSVNRFGSVYDFDEYTGGLIEWYYNQMPVDGEEDVVIYEYNVDTLDTDKTRIQLSLNGDLKELVKGENYTIESETEGNRKMTTYRISRSNFAEDGQYTVTVFSVDEAENESTNQGNLRVSGENEENLQNSSVEFVVDNTIPSIVVTGIEDKTSYNDVSRTMTVDVKDNILLESLEIQTFTMEGGEKVLNEANCYSFTMEELKENAGVLSVILSEHSGTQYIHIIARDKAGNQLGCSYNENVPEDEALTAGTIYTLSITSNKFDYLISILMMNQSLFYGTIAVAAAAAMAVIFFIIRRKIKIKKE